VYQAEKERELSLMDVESGLTKPIIRINPRPTLNIQDRKIFVLSANTLQYASR
jgi:hypothetical protein